MICSNGDSNGDVHRRIGGLEMETSRPGDLETVHRRIGGLEKFHAVRFFPCIVHRRIGGLEISERG